MGADRRRRKAIERRETVAFNISKAAVDGRMAAETAIAYFKRWTK